MKIITLFMKLPWFWRNVIVCSLYILYEYVMATIVRERLPPLRVLIYLFINLALFYSWYYSLKKTEFFTSKHVIIRSRVIGFVSILILYTGVCLLTVDLIAKFTGVSPVEKTLSYFAQVWWRGLYFFIIGTAAYLANYSIRLIKKNSETELRELKTQNENQRLAYELALAQNAYLQGQIDRHMMANALHFAYEKVVRVSDTAAKAISLLSDIVDYGISLPKNDGAVSIDREIEQVNNLISLNRLRFGDKLHLNFDNQLSGDLSTIKILPYLLTTVTENIFQHGDFHNAEYPATIALTNIGSELQIVAENKKRGISIRPGHGIGLENIKTRLNVHYGTDAYEMEIKEDPDFFRLRFKINL